MKKQKEKKNRNENQIKTKLFSWPITTIDDSLWYFCDTFKYEGTSRAWSFTDRFEVLYQHILVY